MEPVQPARRCLRQCAMLTAELLQVEQGVNRLPGKVETERRRHVEHYRAVYLSRSILYH